MTANERRRGRGRPEQLRSWVSHAGTRRQPATSREGARGLRYPGTTVEFVENWYYSLYHGARAHDISGLQLSNHWARRRALRLRCGRVGSETDGWECRGCSCGERRAESQVKWQMPNGRSSSSCHPKPGMPGDLPRPSRAVRGLVSTHVPADNRAQNIRQGCALQNWEDGFAIGSIGLGRHAPSRGVLSGSRSLPRCRAR